MGPNVASPVPIVVKLVEDISLPGFGQVDTSSIGTKRKIVCFSGTGTVCEKRISTMRQLFVLVSAC